MPSLKTIPIVLFPGETPEEDESRLVIWVYSERHLRNFRALRASYSDVDVRLERKLRYEFAKLKARRKLDQHARRGHRVRTPAHTSTFSQHYSAPAAVPAGISSCMPLLTHPPPCLLVGSAGGLMSMLKTLENA